MRIVILGAGAMGASLCLPFTDAGHDIDLWATHFDAKTVRALKSNHAHPGLDVRLPGAVCLRVTDELEDALMEAQLIIIATNTQGVTPVVEMAAPFLPRLAPIITVAKGFLRIGDRSYFVAEGVERLLARKAVAHGPVLSLAGPSIAGELARCQPTAVVLAGDSNIEDTARSLSTNYFTVRPSKNHKGIEACAAFKNIYSIGLAWTTGLSEDNGRSMKNLEAILFVQTLAELRRIVTSLGGDPEAVSGLAGAGDFIATADAGRNGALGRLLGAGHSINEALAKLRDDGVTTIEGLDAAPLAAEFLEKQAGIELANLPFFSVITSVLDGTKLAGDALDQFGIGARA